MTTRAIADQLKNVARSVRAKDVYVARAEVTRGRDTWPFKTEGPALIGRLGNASLDAFTGATGERSEYVASLVEQELCLASTAFVGGMRC